jgi:ABC-type polysaccharide/polyol phosphate transport system ATPase subunit
MSKAAIVVENLSKRYLIGHRHSATGKQYTTLRDVIGREFNNFVRKAADLAKGRQVLQGDEVEEFWALKDVSFEVKPGEVLGIIGSNGAGKSTLLKILSRITEPTAGRAILDGRVASLLEVGTGFHPELTGRENIFLNGAILGMTRREVRRKFDEIVAFAEVEKFLDTPVKHYSSGMYVRLAFAVAAHLEPEILVVDEVLSVGDLKFQKKSLGKMDEVSRTQGRTVLFVSHNMDAVLRLCSRALLLESGSVFAIGDAKAIVATVFQGQPSSTSLVDLSSKTRPSHTPGGARLAKVCPAAAGESWSFPFGQPLSLDLSIDAQTNVSQIEIFIAVYSASGSGVASWRSKCSDVELSVRPGMNTFRMEFQHIRLFPGLYSLSFGLRDDQDGVDFLLEAVQFEITSNLEAAQIAVDIFPGALIPSVTISILD